jgi:hypothetical protein
LICIPQQAWPCVGLQAGWSGCQSHQYPDDKDGVSIWSVGILGPPDIIAAWEDCIEFWGCESLRTQYAKCPVWITILLWFCSIIEENQFIDFALDLHMGSTWCEQWPGLQLSSGFCLLCCLLHVNAGTVPQVKPQLLFLCLLPNHALSIWC